MGISALLVAENGFIHGYFKKVLGGFFEELKCLKTTRGALKAIREADYRVVFINEYLPDGNTLDLLGAIRKNSSRTRVVLMITHKCDSERLCRKYGAAGTLLKPFCLREIEGLLGRLLSTRSASRGGRIPALRKG